MNDEFRRRVFTPVILPLTAVGAILLVAWSLSRVLLAVPEVISTFGALLIAAYVLFVAAIVASRPRISSRALSAGLALGLLGVIGAGVAAGAAGMRELEHEEEAPAGEEAPPPNTWVAVDIDFAAAPEEVAAGSEVTLVNEGQAQHNVTIVETDEIILDASGGEEDSTTLELEPGTYNYVCSVPGHAQFMNGTLTVTE